jgi:hypothetical protein
VLHVQGIAKDAELRAYWTYCQQYPLTHPSPQQQQQQQQQQNEPAAAATAAAAAEKQAGAPREVLLPLTALAHSKQLLQWLRQEHKQQQQQRDYADPRAAAAAAAAAENAPPTAVDAFDDGDVPGVMRSVRQLLGSQAAAGKLLPGEHVWLCFYLSFLSVLLSKMCIQSLRCYEPPHSNTSSTHHLCLFCSVHNVGGNMQWCRLLLC